MSEYILYSDPLEVQNNRQATKISYLQKEVSHLQDHVKDLEHLLQVNRETLKIMNSSSSQVSSKNKLSSQNDLTESTIDNRLTIDHSKNFRILYEQSQEENSRLFNMVEKLKTERTLAQTKALLSEQICEEVQRHEDEIIAEMDAKILELRKMLQDKEYFIQQLEKVKPFPLADGVVVKFREVMDANEQNMKLHDELENYNMMITKMAKDMNKLRSEKEYLTVENANFVSELTKVKAILLNPVHSRGNFKNLEKHNEPANNLDIRTQRSSRNSILRLPTEENICTSPRYTSSRFAPVNARNGAAIQTKSSQFRPDHGKQLSSKRKSSPFRPTNPILDMKLVEKIHELEDELDITIRRLDCEMMNSKSLSDELARVNRTCQEMIAINEIIGNANRKYEEKWRKTSEAMEFYKGFYHKYMNVVTKRQNLIKDMSMDAPDFEKFARIREAIEHKAQSLKPNDAHCSKKRHENKEGRQIEGESEDYQEARKDKLEENNAANSYHFSKAQSIRYLQDLAKDLYATSNIHVPSMARQILEKVESRQSNKIRSMNRTKRSLSNPLDYVAERRKLIYEPVREKEESERRIKKHQKKMRDINFIESFEEGFVSANRPSTIKKKRINHLKINDEPVSFDLDSEEFDREKAVETSFISNEEILEHLE